MAVTFPDEIQELRSFLKQGAGMTTVSTIQHEGFGDICMTLANETVQVRFVLDRSQWSIQLAPAGETEILYDADILREMLTGDACDAPSSLAEMAETLIARISQMDLRYRYTDHSFGPAITGFS